jgi:hypothetical protein
MESTQTLQYEDAFSAFVDIVLIGRDKIIKGKKPHPKNLKLSFKGATVNLSKTSHDQTHSFYRGTLTANGNVKNVNFTITRDRDVVKHVMAMLEKAAK